MIVDTEYCASSFLSTRTILDDTKCFSLDMPPAVRRLRRPFKPVSNANEILAYLRKSIANYESEGRKYALMLSGGIDSAIFARLLPSGSKAYTLQQAGLENDSEIERAKAIAHECKLDHELITVTPEDYVESLDFLMSRQGFPVHSITPQIFKAAKIASDSGFDSLIFGETADLLFGGQDGLFGKRRTVEEFAYRYSYVWPQDVLENGHIDMEPFERHALPDGMIDVQGFMKDIFFHEATDNYTLACESGGVDFLAPFSELDLKVELDLERIGAGEGKYLIREIYYELFPDLTLPPKIPMPRALGKVLANWRGPKSSLFRSDLSLDSLSLDQQWLVFVLDRFLGLLR